MYLKDNKCNKTNNDDATISFSTDSFYYMDLLPEAVVIQRDDIIVYFNSSFGNLTNKHNLENIMGESFYNIFQIDKERLQNITSNTSSDTKIQFIEIQNFDGSALDVEVKSSISSINYQNQEVIIIRDITMTRNTRKNLAKSQIKYEKLLGILPDAICIHNNDTYSFVNENFAKMFGYESANEIIGMPIKSIVHPEYHEKMHKRFSDVLNSEEALAPLFLKCKSKDGLEKHIESNSTMLLYNDEINVISVLQDITYKVNYEELQMKMVEEEMLLEKTIEYDKQKTLFLSNISHELRTPLNILLSSLQMLNIYTNNMDNMEVLSIKNYLRMMKQNCYRLLRLINNFIDVSKIETGFYQLNSKNVNIVNIIEEITLSVVDYMKNKNIDIIFDTEIEEKIVSCDEDKLERIILNLLSNAIKFTAPGGKIQVNIYDGDSSITISVKDTGVGIPEDKLKGIFDRFSQVNNQLTKENEGSGIGLSLVKSLVEMHGGKIEVNSIYGEGTEFLIYFPVDKSEDFYQIEMDLSTQCESTLNSNIEKMNIEFSEIYLV
jgi:PAS domain S-box-containing protein